MTATVAAARVYNQPLLFVARLLAWSVAVIARFFSGFFGQRGTANSKAALSKQLVCSKDYDEWVKIAVALDEATGNASWRANHSDGLVNTRVLEESIAKMKQLRASNDVSALLRLLQPCISRSYCGINNEKLFRDMRPALAGSKFIVEEFVAETARAINFVAAQECKIGLQPRLQWMLEARHSHGKTALLLSGGASFGLYHLGVVKALHRAGMLPKILAGSSAGSIMAAMVATRANDQEMEELFDGTFSNATFSQAFDQKGSLRRKITRFLTTGRLFDIGKLSAILRAQLGDVTFLEAFKASGRILNVTVSPASSCDSAMLLNHITAPDVLIWSACSASCAFPLLYEPVRLQSKSAAGHVIPAQDSDVRMCDGSLSADLPHDRLKELFNVQVFIVSQVNPHVVKFLENPAIDTNGNRRGRPNFFKRLLVSEMQLRMQQLCDLHLLPRPFADLVRQKWTGDITIVPDVSWGDYKHVVDNPSPARTRHCACASEHKTWEYISDVRVRCSVELALDDAIRRLKLALGPAADAKPMARSPSWIDLCM